MRLNYNKKGGIIVKEKKHNGFKTFVMVLTLILVSPVFSISVSASELTDNEKLHTETTGASKEILYPIKN